MTFTFHALWLLCAFASTALAAIPSDSPPTAVLAVVGGFAAGAWWFGPARLPDAVWVGIVVAFLATVRLVRADGTVITNGSAGVLAAIWLALLRAEGLPWAAGAALAIAPPMLASYLTTKDALFAPRIVRDEALLIVMALGLGVAVLPGILEGWRSAMTLNIQDRSVAGQTMAAWTLGLTAGSVALGGLVALWRRG